ncbi:MAG: AraC family transcriptional regulator [Ekhidna sp.]|nr:AraC family transcriptional regulator [Ekhidna sp.]
MNQFSVFFTQDNFYSCLLLSPFFFLYVRSLANELPIKASRVLVHTLPYLVLNAIIFTAYDSGALKLYPRYGFLGIQSTDFPLLYHSGNYLAMVTVAYIAWGFWLLKEYKRRLNKFKSNMTDLKWMQFLVFSFLIYFLAIYFILVSSLDGQMIEPKQVFYYVSFIIMAYIFALGFLGIKQREVFSDIKPVTSTNENQEKYIKSGLTISEMDKIESALKTIMEGDQLYLNPEISLPELAAKIEVKPNYLSQVINQQFGQNFFDFINQYRVEEVKKRILDPQLQHLSLLGIGLECGFKSKSSFNKSFKKHTGMTPSEFKIKQ